MDGSLVFFSEISLREWAGYLYQLLLKLNVDADFYDDEKGILSVCCTYFTFFIPTDEEFGMDYYWEVFAFKANIEIFFQLFWKTYDQGIEVLFQLLSLIIKEKADVFMLLDDNGRIILKREGNELCTYTYTLERYRMDGTIFPFDLLGREIKVVFGLESIEVKQHFCFPEDYKRMYLSGFRELPPVVQIHAGDEVFYIKRFLTAEEINDILAKCYDWFSIDYVPIAETDGDDYICLYYSQDRYHPSVIYWNYNLAAENQQEAATFLADSFEKFTATLK